MAAAMTMDREPEVARFIDSYKFDQDMTTRRDKYGGGTSLPLNSDGYEEKQSVLRQELHKDMLMQQEKNIEHPASIAKHPFMAPVTYGPQSAADYDEEIHRMTNRYHNRYNEVILDAHEHKEPVYYRVGTPEQGFPGLGEYENLRKDFNLRRQKEYNDMLKKQRQAEQKKFDARRRSPPRPAQPPGPQMDYNLASEQARADERRAYQDYMGKYESPYRPTIVPLDYEENQKLLNQERRREYNDLMEQGRHQYPINAPPKPPIDYEKNKKVLSEERKKEYNQMIEKKAKEERYWAMRGRPVTPAGGLNIGGYDRQVKETAQQKKKEYKEMLDQQKFDQLKLRAMDHVAEMSPKYVKYREDERPIVGSPRDINYYMQEKESKDKFRSDLRSKPKQTPSPSAQNVVNEQTPADDTNYKAFLEVEKEKLKDKRKYAEELLQQQKEHMFLRARQEPEMAVLDRNAQPQQFLADKPPPGPSYGRGRDEPNRQTPAFWNDGRQAHGPTSLNSDVSGSNRSSANVPMASNTESQTRYKAEQPYYAQPSYPGVGVRQNNTGGSRVSSDAPKWRRAPAALQPRSPQKQVDRELFNVPGRGDERQSVLGTSPALKTESQSRPIPERPRYGQPPYPGAGVSQNDTGGGRVISDAPKGKMSPVASQPRSPPKPVDRVLLKVPLRDDERPSERGTPLAFKTDSQNHRNGGHPIYPEAGQGQNEARHEDFNPKEMERPRPPVDLPPRSPEKPANPEWLKVPLRDDERPSELGTPMAFKTDPYSRQPPPAPDQSYSHQTLNAREQSDPRQPPRAPEQGFSGPPFSRDGVKPYEKFIKYENGAEGLFGIPQQTPDRPRSRRSLEADRRHSPSKREDAVMPSNKVSPRRMKNVLYEDSEEVSSKRREASKERQKEYNEFLKIKAEERRRHDEMRHQQQAGKPAEVVKNPYYSSDDYEKFQREIQRVQGEEYKDFLKKSYQPPPGRIGLPLGQYKYEPKRLVMEAERNSEWNRYSKEQYEPGKDAQGLPLGQYRYEPKRLELEAERNKEYNDLLRKKLENTHRHQHDLDDPQGLNIDVHYHRKKQAWLEKQRNKDYNEYMRQEEEQRRNSRDGYLPAKTTYASSFKQPPPSPHRHYHQTPPSPAVKRREQTPDQMSTGHAHRGRDERALPESNPPVQNGYTALGQGNNPSQMRDYPEHNPFPSNASEPGDYRPKMPDYASVNPGIFHQQMTAAYPKASSVPPDTRGSLPATPSKLSLPVGQYDDMRPFFVKQRNKEYNSIKDELGSRKLKPPTNQQTTATSLPVGQYDDMRPQFENARSKEYQDHLERLPPLKKTGMTPRATDVTLPVGQYDSARQIFEKQRNDEYNNLVQTGKIGKRSFRQKAPTPPELQGLPIGQNIYEPMHKAMEYQRNKEYNDFLKKKYGGKAVLRSTRSEPAKADEASFYYGNEMVHEQKKKMLDEERKNEYNQYVKELEPPRSRSMQIPADIDSGLSIGQQHHEAWKKFLGTQRNKEYNQLLDRKSTEVHKRDWNFEQNGVLELHGDDAIQVKQRELRAERQKDYNNYISQMKAPSRRTWPEPDGRGALLVKKGEYDNVRQMYDDQRKRDYIDRMQKRREMGLDLTPPSAPTEPLRGRYEYYNPMINVLGRYDDYRKKLADDRKRDFRTFMNQVKADDSSRRPCVSTAPNIAREETPLVNSMGTYELETKSKMRAERKKDLEDYVHEQKHWTPRTTVKENLMPHVASAETPIVNYMGQYDKEKLRHRVERNKDFRDFSQKKKQQLRNPYDNYVFPTVAVAEKPIVDYMGTDLERRQRELRDERRRDYEEYKMQVAPNNQKYTNPGRRHDFVDTASGPYGGLLKGLGDHGNRSDVLNQERRDEYNEKLEKDFGKDRPSGRPSWARDALPNNTDRGRSPNKTQPPADQYQQMLDAKRREESSRRRYEDPEYQGRLAQGWDRGEAGGRYGY